MSVVKKVDAELAAKRKARFPRVWLDEAKDPGDRGGVIKGVTNTPTDLVVIAGASSSGKSFFVDDLLIHVAAEIPWRGHRVRGGLCVYIAAEAGESCLRRFQAMRDAKLGESHEGRTPLAIVTRGANLLMEREVDALVEELRDIAEEVSLPLRVVCFDTLSRSIPGGDENSSEHMTAVVGVADRLRAELGAGTWIVHHAGKDANRGPRGHSSLFAAADVVIGIAENVARIEKSRDHIAGTEFPFRLEVVELGLDDDGDPVTTCLVVPADSQPRTQKPEKLRPLTGVGQVALKALREVITEFGEVSPGTSTMPRGVKTTTIERWRERFRLRYGEKSADTARKAFDRGREQLLAREEVCISDPHVWLSR